MVYVAHGRSVRATMDANSGRGADRAWQSVWRGLGTKGDLLIGRIHRPVIDLHDSRIRKQQRCKIHRTSIEGVSYESYQQMHNHQKTA